MLRQGRQMYEPLVVLDFPNTFFDSLTRIVVSVLFRSPHSETNTMTFLKTLGCHHLSEIAFLPSHTFCNDFCLNEFYSTIFSHQKVDLLRETCSRTFPLLHWFRVESSPSLYINFS